MASQLIANLQSPKVEQRVETSNRKRKRPSEEVQRIPEVTIPEPSTTESPSLFDLQRYGLHFLNFESFKFTPKLKLPGLINENYKFKI